MTQVVSDEKLGEFARRQNDWFRRVREGTLDPDEVTRAVHDIIEKGQGKGLFIPTYQQLNIAKQRNIIRKWGFAEEHFVKLGEPPAWPEGKLCAVVLDVGLNTVQQTFEEAWACIIESQKDHSGAHSRWDGIKSNKDHLRLNEGIAREWGLRWRIVDLGSNWDTKNGVCPQDVRNSNSPHSVVLWAASYFHKWVQQMDGTNVPYVWIPGYELNVVGSAPWTHVPTLSWSRVNRAVKLHADFAYDRDQAWAVPSPKEC